MKSKTSPALIIWPPAVNDIEAIVMYIRRDNPDAAGTLKDDLYEKIADLPRHPRLYRRGRVPGTREMVVRRNYIVIYSETPDRVTVLRVIHAAMKWP